MAWHDSLRRVRINGRLFIAASFRGVPFFVEDAEMAGGRRTVTHEYPGRSEPFVEDMGRKARTFPIEAYVIGEACIAQRDAVVRAVETEGVGELIHPYFGTRKGICTNLRVRHTRADGRIVAISLEFQETPAQPLFPSADDDAQGRLEASADAGMSGVGADYLRVYRVSGMPQYSLDSIAGVMRSASKAMDRALLPVVRDTQALSRMKNQLDNIFLDADSMVRRPFRVVSRFNTVFSSLFNVPQTPSLSLKALLRVYGFTSATGKPQPITATRRREASNYAATDALVRRMAIVQAAKFAPSADYDSYEDALQMRDAIAVRLDDQMDGAGDDLFSLLQQLSADLVKAVPGDDNRLARLVSHTPMNTVPSLALVHQLYGDVTREGDVIARNRVRHPGFVPGGRQLEIISRA